MESLSIYARTPLGLECAIWDDLKQRISYFLEVYKFIPLSFLCLFKKQDNQEKYRILKAITVISCFFILRNLSPDKIYHTLKVQSLIRLYVLFGVLELAEKLFGTLVDDFALAIDDAYGREDVTENHINLRDESVRLGESRTNSAASVVKDSFAEIDQNISTRKSLKIKIALIIFSILVTLGHTLILYFQYLIILLSLNSSLSVLYSLIISVQFIELRGNVTKRGDKKSLFVLVDNDGLKRFNLSLYFIVAFLMRWTESESMEMVEFFEPILIIFFLKISIDWIKHAFFCRYNEIDPSDYSKYKNEYKKRNNFVSHNALLLWLCDDLFRLPIAKFLIIFFGLTYFMSIIQRCIF